MHRHSRLLTGGLVAVCLLLSPVSCLLSSALPDWPPHLDVPEWARRGNVCRIFPARPDPVSPAALTPDLLGTAPAPAARAGRFLTVCARSLPRDASSEELLSAACVIDADGKRLLLDNDPRRLVGCWSAPRFRAYLRAQMTATHPRDGVILDNVLLYDCHCPICRQRFREFSRAYLGREADLPGEVNLADPIGRATRAFELCGARECLLELKGMLHAETPPAALALSLPPDSGVATWLIHEGIPDFVLFRRGNAAAGDGPSCAAMKLALAASQGKCVAAWQDASPDAEPVAAERRMLGLAEAISAGATEVTSQPGAANDPLAPKWWGFAEDLIRRRDATHSAARVAVLCSIWTGIWQPQAQHLPAVSAKLGEMGLPFDFVLDEDVGPQLLRQYPLLIVPNATCISDSVVQMLQAYGDAGGYLILSGCPGTCTDRGDQRVGTPRFQAMRLVLYPRPLEQMAAPDLLRRILAFVAPLPRLAEPSASLTFNLQRDERTNSLQVHLVNRDTKCPVSDAQVLLPVGLCRGWHATLTSPDHEPRTLEMPEQSGYLHLTVPRVGVWATVIIEPD